MLTDARTIENGTTLQGDVCIIGGGPAGLTLAAKLAGTGMQVVLVETGGKTKGSEAEALLGGAVRNSKFAPMTMYRRRVLGGASTIWGGRCVPMDPVDFEARDFVPNSGWPIPYEEVARYYPEATGISEAGRPEYDAGVAVPSAPDYISGFRSEVLRTSSFERFSLPTNFWKRFSGQLAPSPDVRIVTHATAIALTLSDDGARTASAECATLDGRRFRVAAGRYVLACGGVEVYRLLAASRAQRPSGIGNEHDVLGRYFMSHIEGSVATLRLTSPSTPIAWGFDMTDEGIYGRRRMQIDQREQRSARLLNMIVRLHHANPVTPEHGNAVLSTMFVAKSVILPEYRRKITMAERTAADRQAGGVGFWLRHLGNIAAGSPGLAMFLVDWVRRRNLAERKIPYVVLPSRSGEYPLDFNSEQVPTPESRLLLSGEVDRFGVPFADVDWRMTDIDVDSIARSHRIMDEALGSAGVARLVFPAGDLESAVRECATPIGGHHLGVTRMGTDVRTSVVDPNLRLHSVDNLFVASGCVFPTSGHANPTLTILALALRLADHLKSIART